MATASWLPAAENDLDDVLTFIAIEQHRPNVAEQIVRQIHEKCDRLAESPLLGEARPELGRDLRLFSFKRWAIVYRPTSDGINVIGLVDAARDFGDYFRFR